MKKILMSTLTAGLAFAMMSTYSVSAEELPKTDAKIKFQGGTLEFREVTDSLNFGEIYIQDSSISKNPDDKFKIVVSDKRGTAEGWTVYANLGYFNDIKENLPGTKLVFDKAKSTTLEDSISKPPYRAYGTLEPGGPMEKIIDAKSKEDSGSGSFAENQGLGRWDNSWSQENISLNIPSAVAEVGDYSAKITWTFQNATE